MTDSPLQFVAALYRTPADFTMRYLRPLSREALIELDVGCLPPEYRQAYQAECNYRIWSFSRGGRTWE